MQRGAGAEGLRARVHVWEHAPRRPTARTPLCVKRALLQPTTGSLERAPPPPHPRPSVGLGPASPIPRHRPLPPAHGQFSYWIVYLHLFIGFIGFKRNKRGTLTLPVLQALQGCQPACASSALMTAAEESECVILKRSVFPWWPHGRSTYESRLACQHMNTETLPPRYVAFKELEDILPSDLQRLNQCGLTVGLGRLMKQAAHPGPACPFGSPAHLPHIDCSLWKVFPGPCLSLPLWGQHCSPWAPQKVRAQAGPLPVPAYQPQLSRSALAASF